MFRRKKEPLPAYMQSEYGKGAMLLELMPHGVTVSKVNPDRKYPDALTRGYTYCAQWKGLKKVYGYSMLEVLNQLRDKYEPLNHIGDHITYEPIDKGMLEI